MDNGFDVLKTGSMILMDSEGTNSIKKKSVEQPQTSTYLKRIHFADDHNSGSFSPIPPGAEDSPTQLRLSAQDVPETPLKAHMPYAPPPAAGQSGSPTKPVLKIGS